MSRSKSVSIGRFASWILLAGSLGITNPAAIQGATAPAWQKKLAALPSVSPPLDVDWLIDDIDRPAGVFRGPGAAELVLDNGLVRRSFRLTPNAATVALDHLSTGESFVRAVRPEAEISWTAKSMLWEA